MLRFCSFVLACVMVVGTALAQGVSAEYSSTFNKGVKDLAEGRLDEGIAAFKRCSVLVPTDPAPAYNLGCGYSRKGELDPAFQYLDKAADLGFGNNNDATGESNIAFAGKDTDLENARKDPRWAKLIERMTTMRTERDAMRKKGEAYAAKPAIYVPEQAAAQPEMGLLIVLHDAGATKDQMIVGRYKSIADELGYALIAPSGKVLVGAEPDKGMSWFEDFAAYMASPWQFEKSVNDAVSAFKKDHKVDKRRVYLVGEGMGGVVATSVAVSGPGLYKGVVALNASIVPQLLSQKAPNAGKMGMRMRLLDDVAETKSQLTPDEDVDKLIASWNASLKGWGIQGGATAFTRDEKDAQQIERLIVEAIQSFAITAEAVPAGAPK